MASALTNNYSLRQITVTQTLDTSQIDASLNYHQTLIDGLTNDGFTYTADLNQLNSRVGILEASMNLVETGQNIRMGQYYKTTPQSAGTGQTSITWDASTAWSNLTDITQIAIDHFQVNTNGIYQLEAHMTCDASGSAWGASNKIFVINITRGTGSAVFVDTRFVVSGTNWGQHTTGTYELQIGDIIHIRLSQTLTSGTALIREAQGMDLNTLFTWTLIKTI